MASVRIGDRQIGGGALCFVIAEAGVNHNGELALAKRLVDAAADAGADAVKFQTWQTDKLVAVGAPLAAYQRDNIGDAAVDQREMLAELELSQDEFRDLAAHAREREIMFLSTPDEEESADFLDELGVPAFKIGSAEVTNQPLLRHVGAKRKAVILSTGMSTLAEVDAAVTALDEAGAADVILLQCTSSYPARADDANLAAMQTLERAFGRVVGYSDHTTGPEVALAAVALGAAAIEKHLTLDCGMPGPDHAASLEPAQFADLVSMIRRVESARGDGVKRISDRERDSRRTMLKVILAARDLDVGETLTAADVILRRSGDGLPPGALDLVVGRTTRVEIAAGTALAFDQLA